MPLYGSGLLCGISMTPPDNVQPLHPRVPAHNGNGGDGKDGRLAERISALEAELKHLATKEDIANLKTEILKGLLWIILTGMGIAASAAALIARIVE